MDCTVFNEPSPFTSISINTNMGHFLKRTDDLDILDRMVQRLECSVRSLPINNDYNYTESDIYLFLDRLNHMDWWKQMQCRHRHASTKFLFKYSWSHFLQRETNENKIRFINLFKHFLVQSAKLLMKYCFKHILLFIIHMHWLNNIFISVFCSHQRSYEYYTEAVQYGGFTSTRCSSYTDYLARDCKSNEAIEMAGNITLSNNGTYYLQTNNQSLYSLG